MDYLCAKFGNFNFSRFPVFGFYRAERITESHTEPEADDRYTHAIIVGATARVIKRLLYLNIT